MDEWLPTIVGLGIVGCFVVSLWILPRSRWSRELVRPLSPRPSGAGGTLSRGDYVRSGLALILALSPGLLGAAYLSFLASERLPLLSGAHRAFTTLAFILFILAGIAGLGGVIAMGNAVVYRAGRTWAGGIVPRIESDRIGLRLILEDQVFAEVSWSDVLRVVAFKRDLITVDEIFLGIVCAAKDEDAVEALELSEEWYGFEELGQLLPKVLPGVPEGWYSRQSRPAFSDEPEVLFDRMATI